GREPGELPGEATREVVAERDRREREREREPTQRLRRTVHGERRVREHEVERRSAAVVQDRMEHVAEGARGDEPRDGLVLVPRLAGDIGDGSCEEAGGGGRQRERGSDEQTFAESASFDGSGAHAVDTLAVRVFELRLLPLCFVERQ